MDEITEIMNKGLLLADRASNMMKNWDEKYRNTTRDEGFISFDIVDDYHTWLNYIRNFLSNKLGRNSVNLYHFSKEIENIPTTDWLDRNHHFNGDYIPYSLLQDIFNEVRKKVSLLREIYEKNENIFNRVNKPISFNEKTRELYFMGKNIIIGKKEESDPHKLVKTLFKDVSKTWNNDEILEDWGYSFDEDVKKNKAYQAGLRVNEIIAQETTVKDLLNVSTKSIKINEKYL